jgi:hypothetical protein
MNNVRELKSQNHIDNLEPKDHAYCSSMSSPDVNLTVNLQHGHCENSEDVKDNLSNEILWLVDSFEMLLMSALVNVH